MQIAVIQNNGYPLPALDENEVSLSSINCALSQKRPTSPVAASIADCVSFVTQLSESSNRLDDPPEQTVDSRPDIPCDAVPTTPTCQVEISSLLGDASQETKFQSEKFTEPNRRDHCLSYNRMSEDFTRRAPSSVLRPFEKITDYLKRGSALRDTCHGKGSGPKNACDNALWEAPHFFLKESIELPLKAQIKVINDLLMYQIIVDHNFLGHIDRIRQTFFLNDGVFGLNLAENLLMHFKDGDVCNYRHYNQLQKILRASRPADGEYLTLVVDDDVDLDRNQHALVSCILFLIKSLFLARYM